MIAMPHHAPFKTLEFNPRMNSYQTDMYIWLYRDLPNSRLIHLGRDLLEGSQH
jgi:hypothetical protein